MKFEDDAPLFPTDAVRILYALNYLEGGLFYNMTGWVRDNNSSKLTWLMFQQQEIEPYLGIRYRAAEAKTKLETIHSDILDKRDLLDRARSIEHNRNSARVVHPQSQFQPRSGRDNNRRPQQQSASSFQKKGYAGQPSLQANANTFAGPPCAVKPASWQSPWYEPQSNPPKLMSDAERTQLRHEGRCYRCRGSGHQATHPVCPMRAAKSVNTNTTIPSHVTSVAEVTAPALADQEN
ncbi:hypothetical protein KEM55_004379 [Ascosphaera atra]|nr:hypothetical protein KEM55_004379 [Ascosphaera atra]